LVAGARSVAALVADELVVDAFVLIAVVAARAASVGATLVLALLVPITNWDEGLLTGC